MKNKAQGYKYFTTPYYTGAFLAEVGDNYPALADVKWVKHIIENGNTFIKRHTTRD